MALTITFNLSTEMVARVKAAYGPIENDPVTGDPLAAGDIGWARMQIRKDVVRGIKKREARIIDEAQRKAVIEITEDDLSVN